MLPQSITGPPRPESPVWTETPSLVEGEWSEHQTSPQTPDPAYPIIRLTPSALGNPLQVPTNRDQPLTYPSAHWLPWPPGSQSAPANRGSMWAPTNPDFFLDPETGQLLWRKPFNSLQHQSASVISPSKPTPMAPVSRMVCSKPGSQSVLSGPLPRLQTHPWRSMNCLTKNSESSS